MDKSTSKNGVILDDFLNEYSSRLSFASTSKVLCFDEQSSNTFTDWCKSAYSPRDQPQIILLDSSSSFDPSSWPHQESSFTHIFATLSPDLATSMKALKQAHYTVVWKGVVVVLPPEQGEVGGEKIDLAKLIELAGFERGKIRVSERKAKDVEGEVAFAMKWDFLSA